MTIKKKQPDKVKVGFQFQIVKLPYFRLFYGSTKNSG